jgi:hypothetical protein
LIALANKLQPHRIGSRTLYADSGNESFRVSLAMPDFSRQF